MTPPMVTELELRQLEAEAEHCDCEECVLLARLIELHREARRQVSVLERRVLDLNQQIETLSELAEQDAERFARTPAHTRVPWSTLYAPLSR